MKWLVVNAKADSHELVISGPIGKSWWDDSGTSSKEFRDAIEQIPKGRKISIRINSEGGSIKDGLEIYNVLKDRRADVTAYVDGYALSIASVIPLAAARVVSPKSSVWMIHEPWSMTSGDAEDHLKAAEMLDKHGDMLADVYAFELGKGKAQMRDLMKKETWFTGAEAVDFGLADETPEEDSAPENYARLDLTKFRNVPANIFNMISEPGRGAGNAQKDNKVKKAMIALLKKHGVTASDDWTEKQFEDAIEALPKNGEGEKEKEKKTKPDTNRDDLESSKRIKALEDRLESQRREHIRSEVKRRGENRVTNDKVERWVDRVMASENPEDIYKEIDEMVPFSTTEPAGASAGHIFVGAENPLEKIQQKHKDNPKARYDAMRKDWKELYADAVKRDQKLGFLPVNTNTYSATLVANFLMDGSVTDLQNRWAMLRAFSMEFSTDAYKPLASGVLKHVTVGATAQTDASNFESGNSTVAPVTVAVHQYTVSFQVSNSDLNNGLRMQDLVTINSAQFANKVIEVATAPITAAIFTNTPVVSAAGAFSFSDLAALQASLKKSPIKNLILDGAYIARIANSPAFFQTAGVVGGDTGAWKAFGWDLIAQNTDWNGAGANVQGFACHPQAIAGIHGLPLTPGNIPGGILQTNTITVPQLEIPIAVFSWFNPATRTMWASYDIVAGFKEVDTTAGTLVTSA